MPLLTVLGIAVFEQPRVVRVAQTLCVVSSVARLLRAGARRPFTRDRGTAVAPIPSSEVFLAPTATAGSIVVSVDRADFAARVATGLTRVIAGVRAILLLDRWDHLAGDWYLILDEHGWALAASALTA